MKPEQINPAGHKANPAFSQAVVATGPGELIFVDGQNAVSQAGEIVRADHSTRSKQTLRNVLTALAAASATQADLAEIAATACLAD